MKAFIIIGIILLVLIVVFVVYELLHVKHIQITHYTINTNGKAKARFAVVSDLHNFTYGKNNCKLIDMIISENVDAVLIPGDLVVGDNNRVDIALEFVKGINNYNLPMYMTLGNHELKYLYDFKVNSFINQLKDNNVTVLYNETVMYNNIAITGYVNERKQYTKFKKLYNLTYDELSNSLPELTDSYNIILAHNPVYFDKYAKHGADLVISGHLHGGIIRLPFVGGLLSPQTFIRGRYVSGKYVLENSVMLVSRGLGVHTIPIRVFNRPELMIVDLI